LAPAPEPEPPQPLAPSRPGEDDPPAASPLDGPGDQDRFLRGVLIHELLEILPDLPAESRRPAADAHLAGRWGDAGAAERDAVADEVLAILDHADFAHLFGSDSRAEVPLTGLVGGAAVSGQIDRLVVRENEVIIVDYKSNRPPPKSTDDVAPAYLRQMALYRALLRQIFPDHAIRCVLLWTHGAYLMPINDTVLDGVLP
jgi:ATP-dependent helicase/nuclease subunit A